MRTPHLNMQIFKERRARLASLIPNAAVILAAHPEQIRNHDVHQQYRQDTNMYYLTGFEEPESIFVFRPGRKPETVMFNRVRDVERETWDGFRYGPEGVVRHFGVEAAYPISEFESICSELLLDVDKVYYTLFKDAKIDARMATTLKMSQGKRRRSGRGILPIYDSYQLIGEMRIRKSDHEAETLKRACQISAEAHVEVMKAVRPGMNERALHGIFLKEIMTRGAAREGYGTIVAGGAAATTLHYVFNDQVLKDGELLLIDAGAEFEYYTGDITRTYPISGKFNPTQRRLYGRVLELQKHLCKKVQPGLPMTELQEITIDGLIEIMMEESLLKGSRGEIRETQAFKKYYPHGVSHLLGSDVHDAGMIEVNGQSRVLEPGMAITIEPGFYIPADDAAAPAELRGIGIRIEDDVLVTADGADVMTSGAPKEIADLEALRS
ncbi:MAG: aminopeptidase P N-terminal domain-containing protein [Bdellovibrionales bacterium]